MAYVIYLSLFCPLVLYECITLQKTQGRISSKVWNTIEFSGSSFIHLNFFLCKHNGNRNILSDFTCFVTVFDTPHETATNTACQLSDHGILLIVFIIK
jgi:hypothetical protein